MLIPDVGPQKTITVDELLSKNVEGKLSREETKELDLLLTQVDELSLVKAHAATTLRRIKN